MKNLLINKLNRDKKNFQNCQKKLLIIEGQELILNFLTHHLQLRKDKTSIGDMLGKIGQEPQLLLLVALQHQLNQLLFLVTIEIFPLYQNIFQQKIYRQLINQGKLVFLSHEGSSFPIRNKLPNIAPLPIRSSVDNFLRPITEITDEKNNTITIMPKNPVLPPIGQRQLSQQLQKIFPDVTVPLRKHLKLLKKKVKTQMI